MRDRERRPGPAIANWSLVVDSTGPVAEVNDAIAQLRGAGILVVASAGNVDRDACLLTPANSGHAFVVGSTSLVAEEPGRWRDVRTAGTAWGNCVDLYAPGDSVPLLAFGGGLTLCRGTSMATGYVSGAAAILLQRHPTAMPDSIVAMLQRMATRDVVDARIPGRLRNLLYIGNDGGGRQDQ